MIFSDMFNNNIAIIIILSLLLLSFLGVNVFILLGSMLEMGYAVFGSIFSYLLSSLGYFTGSLINKTADVVKDTSKLGVDIIGGSIKDVGNILINAGAKNADAKLKANLDQALKPKTKEGFYATSFDNPLQNGKSTTKIGWSID